MSFNQERMRAAILDRLASVNGLSPEKKERAADVAVEVIGDPAFGEIFGTAPASEQEIQDWADESLDDIHSGRAGDMRDFATYAADEIDLAERFGASLITKMEPAMGRDMAGWALDACIDAGIFKLSAVPDDRVVYRFLVSMNPDTVAAFIGNIEDIRKALREGVLLKGHATFLQRGDKGWIEKEIPKDDALAFTPTGILFYGAPKARHWSRRPGERNIEPVNWNMLPQASYMMSKYAERYVATVPLHSARSRPEKSECAEKRMVM